MSRIMLGALGRKLQRHSRAWLRGWHQNSDIKAQDDLQLAFWGSQMNEIREITEIAGPGNLGISKVNEITLNPRP